MFIFDYIWWWEIPILIAFLGLWAWMGGRMLRQGIHEREEYAHPGKNRSIVACLVSAVVALISTAVFFSFFQVLGGLWQVDTAYSVLTGLFSLILGCGIGFLSLLPMFKIQPSVIFLSLIKPAGIAAVLAIVIFVPPGVMKHRQVLKVGWHKVAVDRLKFIGNAIQTYRDNHKGAPPPTLMSLADSRHIAFGLLRGPKSGEMEVGFFYMPIEKPAAGDDKGKQLQACDFFDNHDGVGRAVLYADGKSEWLSEEKFQELLRLPVNADFSEAIKTGDVSK